MRLWTDKNRAETDFVWPEYSLIVLRGSHMTGVRGRGGNTRQSRPPEVIIHVKHIGEQGLGGGLLDVQLLHLLCHHDCLPGNLLSRSSHFKQPGKPLKEDKSNLEDYGTSIKMSGLLIPIQASRGCQPACGGSWGSWLWSRSSRRPWTWWRWSMSLSNNL